MTTDPVACFELHPDVLTRTLDDDLVVYHPLTDEGTHLDSIARAVWNVLEATPSVDELVTALAEAFGAEPDVVGHDVRNLLDELQAKQLVRVADL